LYDEERAVHTIIVLLDKETDDEAGPEALPEALPGALPEILLAALVKAMSDKNAHSAENDGANNMVSRESEKRESRCEKTGEKHEGTRV
jgi:hypothetical protein